jgi:FkbM family methyltransferase
MSRESNEVATALAALCKSLDIKCVVQIGAEDGFEAEEIRKETGCRAVAIDGDPKCCKCSTAIEYFRCLIGDKDEIVNFYVYETMGLSSTLPRNDGQEQHIAVEMYRLDTFCAMHGITPDALIIDTEGTTMNVLKGAEGVLGVVRMIYAECQHQDIRPGVSLVGDVDAFLKEHGFVMRDEWPSYSVGSQGKFIWVRP